ncbi:hypothetical protein EK904_001555, partial [Melospiza melodia maxima]
MTTEIHVNFSFSRKSKFSHLKQWCFPAPLQTQKLYVTVASYQWTCLKQIKFSWLSDSSVKSFCAGLILRPVSGRCYNTICASVAHSVVCSGTDTAHSTSISPETLSSAPLRVSPGSSVIHYNRAIREGDSSHVTKAAFQLVSIPRKPTAPAPALPQTSVLLLTIPQESSVNQRVSSWSRIIVKNPCVVTINTKQDLLLWLYHPALIAKSKLLANECSCSYTFNRAPSATSNPTEASIVFPPQTRIKINPSSNVAENTELKSLLDFSWRLKTRAEVCSSWWFELMGVAQHGLRSCTLCMGLEPQKEVIQAGSVSDDQDAGGWSWEWVPERGMEKEVVMMAPGLSFEGTDLCSSDITTLNTDDIFEKQNLEIRHVINAVLVLYSFSSLREDCTVMCRWPVTPVGHYVGKGIFRETKDYDGLEVVFVGFEVVSTPKKKLREMLVALYKVQLTSCRAHQESQR